MDKQFAFRGGDYPKRGNHFALRFVKLLRMQCIANEIGPEACWLLTTIALVEDDKWYASAPTFYNSQLREAAGFSSEDKLDRVRALCIDMGWLHYEPGGKGTAGVYWVIWPDRYLAEAREIEATANLTPQIAGTSAETTAGEPRRQPRENCGTSYPTLDPKPTPAPELAAVVEKLKSLGVQRLVETVNAAISHGLTLGQIDATIAHYASRPGAWRPGALVDRLSSESAPYLAPDEGWPKPDPAEKTRLAAESHQADLVQARSRETQRKAENEQLRQLELEFGAEVDRLSREEQADLLRNRPGLLHALQRWGPAHTMVRQTLLRAFAERYGAN